MIIIIEKEKPDTALDKVLKSILPAKEVLGYDIFDIDKIYLILICIVFYICSMGTGAAGSNNISKF
jgi:hypothetical protein